MISIIIPTLNEEKILEGMLHALSSKLTLPHEIIVSDGHSKDATVAHAQKYTNKVVEYTGEKRQTIAQGRNDGAKIATGEFLVFLDADCFLEDPNTFFTHALKHFENKNLVAITAWLKILPENASMIDEIMCNIVSFVYMCINNILHIGAASGEFQMIRASSFRQLGGFREELVTGEDLDMFKRLSHVGRTKLDTHLTVYHTGRRVHKLGWPRLLSLWFISTISSWFSKKPLIKEWKEIR